MGLSFPKVRVLKLLSAYQIPQSICPIRQPEHNNRLTLFTELPHLHTSTVISDANKSSQNDNL